MKRSGSLRARLARAGNSIKKHRIGAFVTAAIVFSVFVAPVAALSFSRAPGELVVKKQSPAVVNNANANERARGLVYAGLRASTPSCPRAWAVGSLCTHGPDSAPAGVNATQTRSTASIVNGTDEGAVGATSSTWSVPCYGDGSSGDRVQVVYAHAADVPDRFSSLASSIVSWAGNMDKTFNDSAVETGGIRHVRFVTDSSCDLLIQRVQLSTTGDDSFNNTIGELQSVGLGRSDRKYVVWVDANLYCGIATLYNDDSSGSTNASNVNSGYARIDQNCWGYVNSTEAHELMHTLGGVQYTAPHTSGGGHCTDEYDRMCYADASGVTMSYLCNNSAHERLFDCNHDDYFSTNPPAGSYLATHWNVASSSWLESVVPPAWSPTSSPSGSPTPTATSTPSPSPTPTSPATVTVTTSGSLGGKTKSRSYAVTAGAGTVNASVTFTGKASSVTVSLVNASTGSTIARNSGRSPVSSGATVSAGSYSVVVSASANASFTLTVTYTQP